MRQAEPERCESKSGPCRKLNPSKRSLDERSDIRGCGLPPHIAARHDGFFKHKTLIGEGAFVGTNSSLVAPVKIGNGAHIGSGSVITKDVPDDAMAVERSPQKNREGARAVSGDEIAGEEAEGGVSAGLVELSA